MIAPDSDVAGPPGEDEIRTIRIDEPYVEERVAAPDEPAGR